MTTNTTSATLSTLPLGPGRWELDTNHSRVGFSIRHLGVSKVKGHFRTISGDLEVGTGIDDSTLTVVVDVASLDTGNADRDAHVLSDELLDVSLRPTMTFRGRHCVGEGDRWTLTGDLTLGDVTRPLELDVEFGGVETFSADGQLHAGFEATGELRRKDFGLATGLLASTMLGEVVKLELDVQFTQPAPAPQAG